MGDIHSRCRKCGMFPGQHGPGGCVGAFDPYYVTGLPDFVIVDGLPDYTLSAEDFVRSHQ